MKSWFLLFLSNPSIVGTYSYWALLSNSRLSLKPWSWLCFTPVTRRTRTLTKIYQKGVYSSSEIWHLTHRLYILFKDQHQNFKSESWVWHWRPKSCLNTFYTKFENFSTRCMNALCHAKKYHVWRHAYTMCDIFIHVWRHISYLQLLHIFVFARLSDILNHLNWF